MGVPRIPRLAAILESDPLATSNGLHVQDHLFNPRLPEFALVASALVFGLFDGRVEVEGVPRNVKLGFWVGFVVCLNGFFEAALADETPGADLLLVKS
jgi:hypothetical protein